MPNNPNLYRRTLLSAIGGSIIASAVSSFAYSGESASLKLSRADYLDRLNAIWHGQMIAAMLTVRFEHKVAAAVPINGFSEPMQFAWLDDDWYYEMCALRGFEKYGIDMNIDELGQQWLDNNCGSWGSSAIALENLKRGIPGSMAGHPSNNRYWWTIGPVFSADIYGALAPAMPNVAAAMARKLGKINGHAEAVDGAVFLAGAISLAF
ncbi:MAG: ADP-ribosylation/Crystallin J1 [Hyphomonadaceae bacterium]|nr:MAG: ADP-ribosylation/Crystallin J1 [Hyphomonadaceae bacterium]